MAALCVAPRPSVIDLPVIYVQLVKITVSTVQSLAFFSCVSSWDMEVSEGSSCDLS